MQTYTIRPVILKSKPDKQGRFPVYICLTIDRKRAHEYTGHKLLLKDWDDKYSEVKKSFPNYSLINAKVRGRIREIEQSILTRQAKGENISLSILNGKGKSQSFFEYAESLIDDIETSQAALTTFNYRNEIKRLRDYSGKDLTFSDIDPQYLRKYQSNLRATLSNNSVHKSFKILKRIFNSAIKDKLTDNYPFNKEDNPKYTQTDRTYLTMPEIDLIEEALTKELGQHLIVAGNYFLLGCYSGLRFSDWLRFDIDKMVRGERLILRAQKNGNIVSMKIHKRLQRVIDRLKTLPKIYTEQKVNLALKDLAVIAGINKNITSHTGRHSFATQCAEKGISIETTATWLGISIKTCLVYYRITGTKLDKDSLLWDE